MTEMTEEKPKYIRKKCEHGKYSFQCKECKGASICIHNYYKNICKQCDGKGLCIHKRIKQHCTECHGASICEHDKRRSRCVECKGGSICLHDKLKSRCLECNGSELCEHNIRRERCIDCHGSEICQHNMRKSRCIECNGREICIHQNNKYSCINCHGENICEHNKLQYQCVECKGRLICEHGRRKAVCITCDGSYICLHKKQRNMCITCTPSNACQNCLSVSIIGSRWKPHCFRCHCVLNPDANIPRKFMLKEHYVRDALQAHFGEGITMICNKQVEGGCSKRRPDIFIDCGSHCLMIEVDEHRHVNYSCEEKRMVELYEDIGFRKIVFIRFNPDAYETEEAYYDSPFHYTDSGVVHLDEEELNRRVAQLIDCINLNKDEEPAEQLTVEYLFYGLVHKCV